MKKLILSAVMMLFLLSFTSKSETEPKKEKILSPECFESAGGIADAHRVSYPNSTDELNHAVFEYWYDFCERFSNNDEFEFPDL